MRYQFTFVLQKLHLFTVKSELLILAEAAKAFSYLLDQESPKRVSDSNMFCVGSNGSDKLLVLVYYCGESKIIKAR